MLYRTNKCDPDMCRLADRHYSRQTHGSRQFLPPGRTLVLRNLEGTILFAWHWAKSGLRLDRLDGYCCSIFRNESAHLSSAIVIEAEQWAITTWGANLAFTYVDPRRISSCNPGYCFKVAGYKFVRVSNTGLHLLEKTLCTGSLD